MAGSVLERRYRWWGGLLVLLLLNPLHADEGQLLLPTAWGADTLQKQRANIAAEISRLAASSNGDDPKDPSIEKRLGLLRSLDAIYAQHEGWLEERAQLETRLPREQKNLEALDSYTPNEPTPYSFVLLDRLKDELEIEQARQRTIKSNVALAEQMLQAARQELPAANRQAPGAPETSQPRSSPAGHGDPSLTLDKLPGVMGRASAAAKEAEHEVRSLQLTLSQTKEKQLSKKIDVISKHATFSQQDLAQQVAALATKEGELRQELSDVGAAVRELETTRAREDAQLLATGASKVVLQSAADAWRAAGELFRMQASVLSGRLGILQESRLVWRHRYELANKTIDRNELLKWRDEAAALIDRIEDERRVLDQQRDSAHDDLTALEQAQEQTAWRNLQRRELRAVLDLTEAGLPELTAVERICKRFQHELSGQLEKPANTVENVSQALLSLIGWKVADGDGHSVTAGQLLLLVVCIVAGVICAYYASRWIGRRVMAYFGISRGKAVAIRSIIFYILCLIAGTVAFKLLSIPLAAFAFLGGAAAIAIGFGSQDIMNNFMSGLILLAEQPIRVGDVIDLGSVEGTVTHIGMRSTRVRTLSNHELIVPNKTLLDEQVTNFTLSNDVVRRSVTMTLERSVPVAEAKKKMLRVTRSHPLVLKTPRPVVLVKEVDNYYGTVMFEVYFAMHLNSFMQCATVQSRILERIAALFPSASATTQTPDASEGATEGETAPTADDVLSSSPSDHEKSLVVQELKRIRRRMEHRN